MKRFLRKAFRSSSVVSEIDPHQTSHQTSPKDNQQQLTSNDKMAARQILDVNMFTSPYQLTKSMPRDVYPAIAPTNPALSAKGKVVIITGAGGGLGAVSLSTITTNFSSENPYNSLISFQLSKAHRNDYRRRSRKHGLKLVRLALS